MIDKEANAQKRRVLHHFNKWRSILRLQGWNIVHVWHREPRPPDEGQPSDWGAIADVKALWPYRQARINWFLPTVADVTDGELEEHVAHELVHILVNETREEGADWLKHEERVVTEIAWAFVALERSKHNASTRKESPKER